ncbi:MAG: JAB domain-containing protein [Luminiphilus sp.]
MTDINTINKKHCPSARPWKSSTKNSDVDARAPFDVHAEEARSSYQKAVVAPTLGLVAGLPSIDMAQVMADQPVDLRLDKLIRGLATGDIHHRLWTHSAKVRLCGSFTLHSQAAQEPLRQPLPNYNWHLFESFVATELSGLSRETFMALFLDVQFRLLSSEVLFMGSIDAAPVYPRVVASRALAHHATSVVVAHNHPSGALTPSHSDVAVTQKLSKALKLLDIQLLDHLIAANGRCISLRNLGFV